MKKSIISEHKIMNYTKLKPIKLNVTSWLTTTNYKHVITTWTAHDLF